MKVVLSESQYITIMEDIKKEQYKKLVLGLLKTLFGKLSIEDIREEGKLYKHAIFDQNGENIADIYLERFGNKGCKKDLTLSIDTTERLEGYAPYFRHKIFSKVLIDYVYDELGIKCDCVQYDYDFEREVEVDDDGEEYEYTKSNTRKYNVKKKKKIKESTDKNKKFLTKLLGEDLIDSIQEITSPKQLPIEFLKSIGTSIIQRYIDEYGPLYYFVLDGEPFIYKDRESPKGEKYEMYCNNKGKTFLDGEITDRLGLSDMGLRFSDVIDTIFNEEEDNSPLNEDVDKNKKFLSNAMGVDFTDKIEQVTSVYDVPYNFYRKGIFTMPDVAAYLNRFGPMYIFELDGRRFIYQDRSRYESFISEDGVVYEDKIPEQLGIDIMGLKFSDIIDIYFNEN
jgi:hypothetical protein